MNISEIVDEEKTSAEWVALRARMLDDPTTVTLGTIIDGDPLVLLTGGPSRDRGLWLIAADGSRRRPPMGVVS